MTLRAQIAVDRRLSMMQLATFPTRDMVGRSWRLISDLPMLTNILLHERCSAGVFLPHAPIAQPPGAFESV